MGFPVLTRDIERDHAIVQMYWEEHLLTKEIGKRLNISQQRVSEILKRNNANKRKKVSDGEQ